MRPLSHLTLALLTFSKDKRSVNSSVYEEPWGIHSAVNELGGNVPPPPRNPARRNEQVYRLPPTPRLLEGFPSVLKSVTISVDASPTSQESQNRPIWEAPNAWGFVTKKESNRTSSLYDNSPGSPTSFSTQVREIPQIREEPPLSASTSASSTSPQHFSRLVKRMDNASPKVILDRLSEDWGDVGDPLLREELELEKHLWALTAVENETLDRYAKPGQSAKVTAPLPPIILNKRRKILELDGHMGK